MKPYKINKAYSLVKNQNSLHTDDIIEIRALLDKINCASTETTVNGFPVIVYEKTELNYYFEVSYSETTSSIALVFEGYLEDFTMSEDLQPINALYEQLEYIENPIRYMKKHWLNPFNMTMKFMASPYYNKPDALVQSQNDRNTFGSMTRAAVKNRAYKIMPLSVSGSEDTYDVMRQGQFFNRICFEEKATLCPEVFDRLYKIDDFIPHCITKNNQLVVLDNQYFDDVHQVFLEIRTIKNINTVTVIRRPVKLPNNVEVLNQYVNDYITIQPSYKIGIMRKTMNGYETTTVDIHPQSIDVNKHYNPSFKPVNDKIIDKLNNTNKGLVLLHGVPGSGKSNYLKWLTKQVSKQFIVISNRYIDFLASPEAVNFIIEHKDSVFIIEDCEEYISERVGGGNSSVSTILNLADGILSDVAECQIICTFNTDLTNVDKALMRPGRLIAEYRFDNLSEEHIKEHFDPNWNKGDASLAEVVNNLEEDLPIVAEEKAKPKFGFV